MKGTISVTMGGASMTSSSFQSVATSLSGIGRAGKRRNVAAIALGALACLLMSAPARAGEFNVRGDSLAALREFAEAGQSAPAE